MERFLIGNILVEMDYSDIPVLSEGSLRRFCYNGPWEGETVRLKFSIEPLSNFLAPEFSKENLVYGIYEHENKPFLVYRWGNLLHGFAVWPEAFSVTFDSRMLTQTPLHEDWFFSVCSFHRQLLIRNACVLHASYIDIGGEAILFTGPSNIGKSTQAELWKRYQNAEIINGDRVLLRKVSDRWFAFGYPSCGTSGICINRQLPVRAIVVLSQAPENAIEYISVFEKIRALTAATELYPWNQSEIDMALKIATEISMEVPIVKLSCRVDQEAVDTLKRYLEGGLHDVI